MLVLANIHFIDDWQGEYAYVKVDGEVIWQKSVTANPSSVNICGGDFKEAAFNVAVMADTYHSDDDLKLEFATSLSGDPCLKSLGIDNVAVYVK